LTISYHDNTHLTANEWIPLLDVEVLGATPSAFNEDGEKYYTVTCSVPTTDNILDDHRRVLLDTLSLSLSRAGLIAPSLGKNSYMEIEELSHRAGIVLVPDTNALFNGTLHWLLRIFHHTHVWILPFVVSITQLQQREARLKSLVNKGNRTNLIQALRSRAFVNGTMGLLERYREQYQVLELDPHCCDICDRRAEVLSILTKVMFSKTVSWSREYMRFLSRPVLVQCKGL
jgi:hypothetical protein